MLRSGWIAVWMFLVAAALHAQSRPITALFLGDNGLHRPRERFAQLRPVLAKRGVALTYTDRVDDLNADVLSQYDVLVLYANIDRIEKPQEKALLEFVAEGGGFVALHSASYCFRNSPEIVALVGAQFARHGWGRVHDVPVGGHPINESYGGFESWDETYVHERHNEQDRQVLAYRIEAETREPWTWVRWHGKGRVFYTAWGHDHRTWAHPGFHNLVERGIRWAAGASPGDAGPYLAEKPFEVPRMTELPVGESPFQYVDVGAKIPNYVAGDEWGKQGEPIRRMQKPLSPEESLRRMVVPSGFHVELFAAEPELGGKPICMTWDARGRLWVAETVDYPNELHSPGAGRDQIRICEDTDRDGRADRFTVFADRLSIPTSITFSMGGVIVHNGTETLLLRDTDGDDRADERRTLLSAWSMGDTHGGPSNMQYGLDNWIWGMQGYNKSTIKIGTIAKSFAQGFHRFRPDGSKIEFIRSTNNNTWGFGVSEEGIVFGSTANGHPSIYMPIPNRYYERVRGWTPQLVLERISDTYKFAPITKNVRQVDHHGGYTSGAGHALYTARAYPQQYWNRTAFVCGPTGHLVGTFVLSRDGADFRSTSPMNLLASDDEWTAPIMAEVGPDGCVWVIDWYNYIVQHNPTPQGFSTGKGNAYETQLRDKRHGRIYRVVYGDKAASQAPLDLTSASPQMLVDTLKSDNLFWRRHAQRLLVERGDDDIVPALIALVEDQSTDAIGLNVGAIHALWTLHGLGVLDEEHPQAIESVIAALRHPSAGVRRNAVQVLPQRSESTSRILESEVLDDPDAQVRLMSLLALADMPPDRGAAEAIVTLAGRPENGTDRWLKDAMVAAAARHAPYVLSRAGAVHEPSEFVVLMFRIVAEHAARSGEFASEPEILVRLLESLVDADRKIVDAIVAGVRVGLGPRQPTTTSSPELDEVLNAILARLPQEGATEVVRLGLALGSETARERLHGLMDDIGRRVTDEGLAPDKRRAAARELVALAPDDITAVETLLRAVTPQTSPEAAAGIIAALEGATAEHTGELIADQLQHQSPAVRAAGIGVLLKRESTSAALLNALESGTLQIGDLSLSQRRALADFPSPALQARAAKLIEAAGATMNQDRQKVIERLADTANETGSASEGKAVFLKHCAVCHVHGSEGNRVGPELTGMAVHPKAELLIHILDPSRSVEGNFRQYAVQLADGRVLSGMLVGESQTAIDLIDAEGKRHAILRDEIDELLASTKSLMPDGFEQQMSRVDLVNLLEFLTARGRYLPLDLRKVATICSVGPMFFRTGDGHDRLVLDDWGPKSFAGVPFAFVDPQLGRAPNVVLLNGPNGDIAPDMPRSIELACHAPATSIHMLSGISGWGFPLGEKGSVSLVVTIAYEDGSREEHRLRNGIHFADYIRRVDVPGSQFAFACGDQQLRYLKIEPKKRDVIDTLVFAKGDDDTAPIIVAVTLEHAAPSPSAQDATRH